MGSHGYREEEGRTHPRRGGSFRPEGWLCICGTLAPLKRNGGSFQAVYALAKVYEVDVLRCPRCGSPMKVLAVITDPAQVRRILLHPIKTGLAPPGLDDSMLG